MITFEGRCRRVMLLERTRRVVCARGVRAFCQCVPRSDRCRRHEPWRALDVLTTRRLAVLPLRVARGILAVADGCVYTGAP